MDASSLSFASSQVRLFQHAFEHAPIGMALVSPEGNWLLANKSMCDIVGYTMEELLRLTFQEVTHPDDLELDLAYVHRLLRGEGDRYQIEKRYFHKDGHIVWVLLSVSIVRDAKGEPQLFVSQVQDISAQKEAEGLREAVFRLPVALHFLAGADGHFQRVSPGWSDALGYLGTELLNRPYLGFVHPDDREGTLAEIKRLYAGGAAQLFENRFLHADGNYRWLLWSAIFNKQTRSICGVALDYTERKEMELRLAATLREKEVLLEELQSSTAEIQNLRHQLLTVCAWTKRIRHNGQWMTTDEFLRNHLQLNLTHGISEEAVAEAFGPEHAQIVTPKAG